MNDTPEKPETISVQCPGCAKNLRVPVTMAGKTGRCPACKAAVGIPAAEAAEPPAGEPLSEAAPEAPAGGLSKPVRRPISAGVSRDRTRTPLRQYSQEEEEQPLFRIAPGTLAALVALTFFLPLLQMECMGIKAHWSGPALVTGAEPKLTLPAGMPMNDSMKQGNSNDIPKDFSVLGYLILGAVASVLLFMRKKIPGAAVLGVLLLLFIFHATAGFSLEREFKAKQKEEMNKAQAEMPSPDASGAGSEGMEGFSQGMDEMMAEMTKGMADMFSRTFWFWLGMVATILALLLTFLPDLMGQTRASPADP